MPSSYPTLIHERVAQCQAGENEKAIGRVASGWVVLGDVQFLRGYALLLADPVVPDLNALDANARKTFLYEMSVLGDVLLSVTEARLINYEMLGNAEHALHAHLFPRYADEPEALRRRPAWFYAKEERAGAPFALERDRGLMDEIRGGLQARGLLVR